MYKLKSVISIILYEGLIKNIFKTASIIIVSDLFLTFGYSIGKFLYIIIPLDVCHFWIYRFIKDNFSKTKMITEVTYLEETIIL